MFLTGRVFANLSAYRREEKKRVIYVSLVAAISLSLLPAYSAPAVWQASAPGYKIVDLGRLMGNPGDIEPAVNQSGVVAGWAAQNSSGQHACLWKQGRRQDLGALPGFPDTFATSLNAQDDAVGVARKPGDVRAIHAFLWRHGKMLDLGGKQSSAFGINTASDVVGVAVTVKGESHAVRWHAGSLRDLGTLAQGNFSAARAINASGQIVGVANVKPNGQNHAFLYTGGKMQDLGLFPGGSLSHARAINDHGQVVGWADKEGGEIHPFLWSHGQMQDIGTLHDYPASAWGINNRGQVVGAAANERGRQHAFLWEAGTMTDLNALLPRGSGWTLQFAYQINDQGQIVGKGMFHGAPHTYLLTPLTLPAAETAQRAADFQLTDTTGQTRALRSFQGHPIVLCFFCGCRWCHEFAQAWGDIQRSGVLSTTGAADTTPPKTVVVFAGEASDAESFVAETHLEKDQTVLLSDARMQTAMAYQAIPCPRIYVLNSDQSIRYTNNHKDDAPQKASAVVLLSRALDALRAMAKGTSAPAPISRLPQSPEKEKTHG